MRKTPEAVGLSTLMPPPRFVTGDKIVENLEAALDRFRKVTLSLQSQMT